MGVGKTPQLIAAARHYCRHGGYGVKVLILVTKHNLPTWKRELAKWWPEHRPEDITLINWGQEKTVLEWIRPETFALMIVDEAHRLTNRKSKRFQTVSKLAKLVRTVWLATGTPIRNHPSELVPLALVCGAASYYWPTIQRHFATCATEFGGYEIGGVKDMPAFQNWVSSWCLRRSKREALPDLPDRTRRQLFCEMTPRQAEVYSSIRDELAVLIGDDLVVAPNRLAATTRLRQLLVAPELLKAKFKGGNFEVIRSWAKELQENETKGVIFTPYKRAIQYLIDAAGFRSRPGQVAVLCGGLGLNAIERMQDLFASPDCRLAICTIEVAEGFSLTQANEVLFAGCEWTMAANEQAEDRCWRFGQTKDVRVQYLSHLGTVEEDLLSLLETKASYEQIVHKAMEGR